MLTLYETDQLSFEINGWEFWEWGLGPFLYINEKREAPQQDREVYIPLGMQQYCEHVMPMSIPLLLKEEVWKLSSLEIELN